MFCKLCMIIIRENYIEQQEKEVAELKAGMKTAEPAPDKPATSSGAKRNIR